MVTTKQHANPKIGLTLYGFKIFRVRKGGVQKITQFLLVYITYIISKNKTPSQLFSILKVVRRNLKL